VNGGNSNDTCAPCLAQVSDILGGKKHLLHQDDLVVTTTATSVSPGFSQTAIANLYSTNSTLTFNNNVPWTIGNYAANNFQTAAQ